MAVRILTIPFDPQTGGFPDDELRKFLLNKKLRSLHPQFFELHGTAYWTVFVEYESVVSAESPKNEALNTAEGLLYRRLQEWRKETAEREGVPVFIVATNKQLVALVKQRPMTLEALRSIQGFGKKKVSAYGKALVGILKAFFEKKPLHWSAYTPKAIEKEPEKADA